MIWFLLLAALSWDDAHDYSRRGRDVRIVIKDIKVIKPDDSFNIVLVEGNKEWNVGYRSIWNPDSKPISVAFNISRVLKLMRDPPKNPKIELRSVDNVPITYKEIELQLVE